MKSPTRRTGLARALSKLGYCSRSQAAELIRAGAVRLNGRVQRDPEVPVLLPRDRITVNQARVQGSEKIYLALNKPRGVVTTRSDEQGRRNVYGLLPPGMPWLAPVGRLDKASEGLLLLTNDSEWGARIADPATHLEKTYHVQLARVADDALLEKLVHGVVGDGQTLCAKRASLLRAGSRNSWIEVVLDEGRNRQIRRMLEALGIETLRLVRVAIGPLALGGLAKGSSRAVTEEEKRELDLAMARRSR